MEGTDSQRLLTTPERVAALMTHHRSISAPSTIPLPRPSPASRSLWPAMPEPPERNHYAPYPSTHPNLFGFYPNNPAAHYWTINDPHPVRQNVAYSFTMHHEPSHSLAPAMQTHLSQVLCVDGHNIDLSVTHPWKRYEVRATNGDKDPHHLFHTAIMGDVALVVVEHAYAGDIKSEEGKIFSEEFYFHGLLWGEEDRSDKAFDAVYVVYDNVKNGVIIDDMLAAHELIRRFRGEEKGFVWCERKGNTGLDRAMAAASEKMLGTPFGRAVTRMCEKFANDKEVEGLGVAWMRFVFEKVRGGPDRHMIVKLGKKA